MTTNPRPAKATDTAKAAIGVTTANRGRRVLGVVAMPLVLALVACSGGDGDRPAAAQPNVVTTVAGTPASASPHELDAAEMVGSAMRQLEQATTGEGGTPRAITADEAVAILRSQVDKVLNQPQVP